MKPRNDIVINAVRISTSKDYHCLYMWNGAEIRRWTDKREGGIGGGADVYSCQFFNFLV